MTEVFKGVTSRTIYLELVDSTTGLPKAAILYTDCTGSYVRSRSARTAITMATLASASAAYSSGGFILVDDASQPGVYRFDVPDAAFASGVEEVVVTIKATGCRTVSRGFVLTDWNKQVAAIPNAAANANGGLPILSSSGTTLGYTLTTLTTYTGNTPQTGDAYAIVNHTSYGNAKLVRSTTPGNTLDVSATGEAGVDWANVGSPTTTLNLTATTISVLQQVTTVTGSVGSIATGGIVAASFAAGAIDAAAIATDAIGSAEVSAAAVTKIQAGLSTYAGGAVASVTGNVGGNVTGSVGSLADQAKADVNAEVDTALLDVGLTTTITGRIDAAVSTRLATAGYTAPPTAAANADAVWDELLSGHVVSGSAGEALAAAGTAGDPWTTALPDAYGPGTAGYIIGTNLDATVSSRSSHSAADVWAVGVRTLSAFAFSVTVGTNNDKTGYSLTTAPPTAAVVADAVWDELLSGHVIVGSAGEALAAAGTAGDPWTTALPGAYGAGTAGKIVGDNLNATVSSRLATAGYTAPLDAGGTATAVWNAATATYGTAGTYGALIKTNLDTTVGSRLATSGYTAPPSAATIADSVWDEAIAGHLAAGSTGEALTDAGSGSGGATPAEIWDHLTSAITTAGSVGKLVKDNLDAAITTRATPAQVSTEVLDAINVDLLVDGKTLTEAVAITAAAAAGVCSGAGTGIETFLGLDGVTERAVVTVDEVGDRAEVDYP